MDAVTRGAKMHFASLYIGGQFVAPGAGTQETITPIDGSLIGKALPGILFSNFAQAGQGCACTARTGSISINGGSGRLHPDTPFNGYKRSGLGREWGEEGYNEYTQIKAITFPVG